MPKRTKSSILMGELSKKKHAGNNTSTAVRVSLDTNTRACTGAESLVAASSSGEKILFYARYNLL